MRKILFVYICLFMGLFLFSGCATLDKYALKVGYEKLSKATADLQAAKQAQVVAVAQGKQDVADAKDKYYGQILNNFQQSSNWTYESWVAAQLNQKTYPSRLADLVFYRTDSSLKFSLKPDIQTIMDANKTLMDELDTQKTSNAQLQQKYDAVTQTAKIAQDTIVQDQTALKQKEDALTAIKTTTQKTINAAQQKVDQANGKVISQQQTVIANDEKDKASRAKIVWGLLALAALFAAGAVYGPLNYKLESGLGVIACVGLAIIVPYIEMWMIFTGFGVVVVALLLSYYVKHHKESQLSNALVGAVQDVKTEANDIYNSTVKPKLQDWMKDHPELDKQVQAKLVDLNLVNKSDVTTSSIPVIPVTK